jgi:hypothetical protein
LNYIDPSGHDPWRVDDRGSAPGIPVTPPFGIEIDRILAARFAALNPGKTLYFDNNKNDRAFLMTIFGGTPDIVLFEGGTYYYWSIKSEKRLDEGLKDLARYEAGCKASGSSCKPGSYWPTPGEISDFIGLDIPDYEVGIRSNLAAPGVVTYRLEASGAVKALAAAVVGTMVGKALKEKAQGGERRPGPITPPPPGAPAFLREKDERERSNQNSLLVDMTLIGPR